MRPVPSDDAAYFVVDGSYDLEAFLISRTCAVLIEAGRPL
jgi:hypothetical protein